jgi:branched-chain amino acid transport system permease protein
LIEAAIYTKFGLKAKVRERGMTPEIALLLAQDGVTTGAIYVLLALGTVLIFSVTRVIFVPFGDIVAYAALTLAALQAGQLPGTVWLVLTAAGFALAVEAVSLVRRGDFHRLPRAFLFYGVLPALPAAAAWLLAGRQLPMAAQVALTLALVLPISPLLYRLAFQPIADASVLVLLMVAVALHFVISGVALVFFGPEGSRPQPLTTWVFTVGDMIFTGQMVLMLAAAALFGLLLFLFFAHTLTGKALRATAVNRVGARLVGLRPATTGALAFLVASGLAGISGILIGSYTTLYYDSGFVIGLKAFVGAIIGGLYSYPGAALGAILVGLLESYAAFWNSAIKEIVVFGALVPILVWQSFFLGTAAEAEEEEEL